MNFTIDFKGWLIQYLTGMKHEFDTSYNYVNYKVSKLTTLALLTMQ